MMVVMGHKSPGPPTAAGQVTPHLSRCGLRAGVLSPRACSGVPRVCGDMETPEWGRVRNGLSIGNVSG